MVGDQGAERARFMRSRFARTRWSISLRRAAGLASSGGSRGGWPAPVSVQTVAQPEVRRYRDDDQPVGDWSDIVQVTARP